MKPYQYILMIGVFLACHQTPELKMEEEKPTPNSTEKNKKVTGIGGIFFKCKDPKAMREWYGQNLGLVTDEYGSMFKFRKEEEPHDVAYLQWSPFDEKTEYFKPSTKEFMINYRVQNIEMLVEGLKASGVTIVDSIESFEYGKFIHIMDPEGNKIELWEPIDEPFTEESQGSTTK